MPFARSASLTWNPTFHTGLRLDIGSCGTSPISLPRRPTISLSVDRVMSAPANSMDPPVTLPVPGSRPITACAVVDLPEPDSPTMATVWPRYTVRLTPRTACTGPCAAANETSRSRIRSSGSALEVATSASESIATGIIVCAPSGRGRRARRRPS